MNGKKIEELYKAHAENTAPDMDALWERIESGLEEKSNAGITSKPIRRKISMSKTAALSAACIAALIIVPVAVRNLDISQENSMTASDSSYIDRSDAAAPSFDINMDSAGESFIDKSPAYEENDCAAEAVPMQTINYEDLELAPTNFSFEAPNGETSGDDFFVEEKVLIETDVIVNAFVDRVYSSGNGSVCYEITADNVETGKTESIILTSATPYVMLENRSYLLPLKSNGDDYSLAFENAPQIELTLDGGMIFHNGWETLDTDSIDVIYPQGTVDDFFYDRMKFSYTAAIETLLEKWHEIKN